MAAIEQNIIFPIKSEDGTPEGTPYHDLVLHKATVDSVVMSLGDKITGDVYYNGELTDITMKEYVKYEGVKYILINPPTKVREGMVSDNSDFRGMTKYSFEFYHPMCKLGNMPFTDVAVSEDEKRYLSESNTFFWIGTCYDYIDKLNKNLENTEWVVVASGNEESEAKMEVLSDVLSFDKQTIAEALKTMYDTWEVPFVIDQLTSGTYYNQGKRFSIVVGLPSNEILVGGNPFVFHFGQGVGLKNNSRTPRNNKIVTRIAGYGSENNIPYGYPQIRWYGTSGAQFTYGDHAGTYNNVVIGGRTFAKVVSYPIYKGILGGQYVELIKHPFTRNVLMPSVYRERLFNKISPYNPNHSVNTSYNPDIELIDYYDADDNTFVNQINLLSPSYEIHGFDKIKPRLDENSSLVSVSPYNDTDYGEYYTFTEFTNRINIYKELAVCTEEVYALTTLYDSVADGTKKSDSDTRPESQQHNWYGYKWEYKTDDDFYYVDFESSHFNFKFKVLKEGHQAGEAEWDDTMDDNGEYKQSYFKVTLPQLTFDMYACAAITEEMEINMRSGACIGCTFPIQVDWEDYKKNFYNANGEFDPVPHTTPNDGHVRDASKYPLTNAGQVTIILQKETSTFGTLMPNIYQQPHAGDKFVILGISLPSEYITSAEEELDDAMVEYMRENNIYYYDYPLKFDEYFLATHTNILEQIHNNTIVRFGDNMALYVKQITIKYGDAVLPQYDITLTDDVEVVLNQIGQVTDDVSRMRVQLNDLQKYYGENIITELANKLSRTADDVAMGRITFQQGLTSIGNAIFGSSLSSSGFVSGDAGRGWQIDQFGNAELESVRIRSFLQVQELLINRLQAQEGDTLFTDNDQIIDVELEQGGTYKLTLKEKWEGYYTAQQDGNIVKGIINTLAAKDAGVSDESDNDPEDQGSDDGGNKYYTSWMRVVATQSTSGSGLKKNQIRVVLYGDEDTPAQKNFAPCNLMNIARWGCALNPNEAGISEGEKQSRIRRQQLFLISSSDGRITKLSHVNTPKLRETNYGTTLGTLPEFIRNWSISSRLIDGRDYLYAQGVVVGDFIKVDINGDPIVQYVDCGEWVDGQTYLVNEYNDETLQWETHDVWHNGAKWRCMQHQPVIVNGVETYYEPEDGSEYWNKIESMPALAVLEMDTNVVLVETDSDGYVTTAVDRVIGVRILLGNKVVYANSITVIEDGVEDYVTIGNAVYSGDENDYVDVHNAHLGDGARVVSHTLELDGRYYIVFDGITITIPQGALLDKHNVILNIAYTDSDGNDYNLRGAIQIAGVVNGSDGFSTPAYFDERFAWSNESSTADVNTSPFTEPYDGWESSIPQNTSGLAYLWRKSIRHSFNQETGQYITDEPQYFRMSGTNGTSIQTRGQVSDSSKRGSGTAYIITAGGTEQQITLSDGDAVTQLDDGHLYQWVTEGGGQWLDLGQFKGEPGTTYYTHIVWATNVNYTGATVTSIDGYTPAKSPNDTTHFWMGTKVDTNSADPVVGTDPLLLTYTWSYTKGAKGDSIDSANVCYALSTSSTNAPSSYPYDDFPSTLNAGYYVWEATEINYSDNSSSITGKKCLGATTDFLSGTEVYATSTSNSQTPTSWSTTYTKAKGYYLWTATRVQYTNGEYDYLNPKCVGYWGEDGDNGEDAYYVSTNPQVVYVETDSNGVVTDTTNHTIFVPFFKGNSSSSTNGTISSATCSSDAINITTTGSNYSRRIKGVAGKTLASPVNVVFSATAYGVTRTTNLIVVPNKKGENGNGAIYLDLDNESDALQYMGDTNLTGSVTSKATLYRGGAPIDEGVTFERDATSTISAGNCTVDSSTGAISVNGLQSGLISGVLIVKATYNSLPYYATFSVQRLDNGEPKYELLVDKSSVVVNKSTGSTTSTINVKVYRTAIDTTTKKLVKTLVTNLSNTDNGLRLYAVQAGTSSGTYNETSQYGSNGFDYIANVNSITQVTFHVTNNYDFDSPNRVSYDYESISVVGVENGQQGEKGDAARQPYEWGKWSDFAADANNYFVANKYESPYFIKEEEVTSGGVKKIRETKWQWVGDDGEWYAPTQNPVTGRNYATVPSSGDDKWELMVTDFKYLISEAQLANYAKFGAGIFDGDYAFSQYGRVDGAGSDIAHYKNFRPEFFKGNAYTMFSGSKEISVTNYPSTTPYEFGTLFLENGINYTFTFTFIGTAGSNIHFALVRAENGSVVANWNGESEQTATRPYPYPADTPFISGEYAIRAYATSGSITFTSITVTADKAFKPNFYIDWLNGEVYGQKGRFVNVTVEGVLNNLVQVIDQNNASNYGAIVDHWSEGNTYDFGKTFFLNPLKVDGYVRIDVACNIHFPSAFSYEIAPDEYEDGIFSGENNLSMEEMRQCLGKKIYILPNLPDDTSQDEINYSFICGGCINGSDHDLLVIKIIAYTSNDTTGFGVNDLSNIKNNAEITTVQHYSYYHYHPNYNTNTRFYIFECKLGQYNGKECIYWEMEDAGNTLSPTPHNEVRNN